MLNTSLNFIKNENLRHIQLNSVQTPTIKYRSTGTFFLKSLTPKIIYSR